MTRIMYDSVNVAHVPDGGDLYAGYVNGLYKNVDQIRARFPDKTIVTITVNTSADANVLDVERGDANPADAPFWCQRQRAHGAIPTVYCEASAWHEVRSAFSNQGIAEPNYWIAQYDNNAALPPGAVAKQYGGDLPGNYDQSIVADFWPGVDQGDDEVTPQDKQDIIDGVVAALAGAPNVAGARLNLAQMLEFIQGDAFNGAKYDLNHLAQLIVQNKA